MMLFNTYIQFSGNIFKQMLGIPKGDNVSPLLPIYTYHDANIDWSNPIWLCIDKIANISSRIFGWYLHSKFEIFWHCQRFMSQHIVIGRWHLQLQT